MSQPGWYPDPQGGGTPRYWDGHRWLDAEPTRRRSTGIWWFVVGIVVIAALVVTLIIQPRQLGFSSPAVEDTRSDRPTVEPWDERSDEPPPPEPDVSGGGQPEECPSVGWPVSEIDSDGRIRGGGISLQVPDTPDWRPWATVMPWMSYQNSVTREVEPGWVASLDVGTVRVEDGFTSPRQAAHAIVACMASSWMFENFTHSEQLASEAFELDGSPGWHVTENIYVAGRAVQGDVVDVYILDLGNDGEFSVVVSCATIDHEPSISEVQGALATMRVE